MSTELKIRLEKQENILARCMVMIQQDIERMEERVEELEGRVDVLERYELSVG